MFLNYKLTSSQESILTELDTYVNKINNQDNQDTSVHYEYTVNNYFTDIKKLLVNKDKKGYSLKHYLFDINYKLEVNNDILKVFNIIMNPNILSLRDEKTILSIIMEKKILEHLSNTGQEFYGYLFRGCTTIDEIVETFLITEKDGIPFFFKFFLTTNRPRDLLSYNVPYNFTKSGILIDKDLIRKVVERIGEVKVDFVAFDTLFRNYTVKYHTGISTRFSKYYTSLPVKEDGSIYIKSENFIDFN